MEEAQPEQHRLQRYLSIISICRSQQLSLILLMAIDGGWCIALTKAEKIRKIQEVLELKNLYADLLKTMGEEY